MLVMVLRNRLQDFLCSLDNLFKQLVGGFTIQGTYSFNAFALPVSSRTLRDVPRSAGHVVVLSRSAGRCTAGESWRCNKQGKKSYVTTWKISQTKTSDVHRVGVAGAHSEIGGLLRGVLIITLLPVVVGSAFFSFRTLSSSPNITHPKFQLSCTKLQPPWLLSTST